MLTKFQYPAELIFKILFLIYGTISFCSFTYGSKPISYIMWACFAFGGFSCICRVLRFRDYIKTPGFIGSILFLLSYFVSTALNRQYELKENIVQLLLLGLFLCVLYLQDCSRTRESMHKEFRIVSIVYIAIIVACCVTGIALMLANYGRVDYRGDDNYAVVRGFMWGRLFGVFLDPNRGSVMGVIAVSLLTYYAAKSEKKLIKALCIILMLPEVLFIAFSDSRTGQVALCCSVLCGGVVFSLLSNKEKGKKKIAAALCLSVAVSAFAFVIPTVAKEGYNVIIQAVDERENKDGKDNDDLKPQIERKYDLKSDPSNRRFSIWKSGVEIWKNEAKTMLFGVSFAGVRPYAYEKLPDTYIVNNTQTDFKQFHNEFITALVSQGVTGLITVLFFVISVVYFVLKSLGSVAQKDLTLIAVLIAAVVASSCSAMLQLGMFYGFSQGEIIFWILLGYLVFFLKKSAEASEKVLTK